jgi:hypothetical protein
MPVGHNRCVVLLYTIPVEISTRDVQLDFLEKRMNVTAAKKRGQMTSLFCLVNLFKHH